MVCGGNKDRLPYAFVWWSSPPLRIVFFIPRQEKRTPDAICPEPEYALEKSRGIEYNP
jgi:hypothetical protein